MIPPPVGRSGLTLVELVVTLLLAGLLGIPVGLLIAEYADVGRRSRDSVLATQLARYEMERLDAANDFFATLTSGSVANYQGSPYTMTRTVTCMTAPASTCTSGSTAQAYKRVIVSIAKPGDPPLAQTVTYRTKYVLFGS